ncbi:MAG: hypothetical protein KGI64_09265 [Xanthomonadaceae bacterium]|nr:hypothetical protein [Xanthomonadaceae bacterium]MDE2085036.1 hypothetical protein [Xanthomonadaceae bacterium]
MKTLLALAVVASLSVSATVHAGMLVDVSVIDRDTGTTLPAYQHDGKFYVAGTPGHRYGVRLTNRSGQRVLAVLSVDGVNAISGETASPDQSGYVLGAFDSTEVDGWRKSLAQIAQFNFTTLSDSYAARTGRPANVGVIGVAVFREKPPVWREGNVPNKISAEAPLADRYSPAHSTATPAAPSSDMARAKAEGAAPAMAQAMRPIPAPQEPLGTGHGARERSEVRYTQFVRASSQPDEIDSVWYDSYRNLVAHGVIPEPRPIAREPQPFPNRFVPDPAG